MDYRTLSFNASVKVVLENKKSDPHFLSSKLNMYKNDTPFAIGNHYAKEPKLREKN